MDDEYEDLTESLLEWLSSDHELPLNVCEDIMIGMLVGLAFAERHRVLASVVYENLIADHKIRKSGSETAYDAEAIASGDERMAAEIMADELSVICKVDS